MTIYLAIKYHADLRNRELVEPILKRLESAHHKTLFALRDAENWGELSLSPRELMRKSFALLDAADLVLVELSEKGVGLGIEAGYAYARAKPIITLAKKGSDVSTTLRGISAEVLFYDSLTDLEKILVGLEL